MRPSLRTGNRAVRQRPRMRFGQADHAVTGAAQRRIHAKNHAMGIGRSAQRCFKKGRGRARGNAAEALPHLFKLPRRDAHARILPVAECLQKQKRRASLPSRRSAKSPGKLQCSPPVLVLTLGIGPV